MEWNFFSRKRLVAWSFALAVAFLTLALLAVRKYGYEMGNDIFPEWDPDVLLHVRRIDQVIGSGGALAINGNDYYSGFPRCYRYPYSPLLDAMCIYLVWLYHAIFPASSVHFEKIIGWVPPVFGAVFNATLFLWAQARTAKPGLALCICFSLICSESFCYFFGYHLLDHHFLESFFLWTWLMAGVSFAGSEEKCLFPLVLGGLLWLGLILGWSGMSRLAFLLVLFTGFSEFLEVQWGRRFSEYVSGTFLVSGALASIFQAKFGGGGFGPLVFSWFQPLFIMSLGIGLMTASRLLEQRERRLHFSIAGILALGILAFLWRDSLKQGYDFVTAGHPFFGTINENRALISFADVFKVRELLNHVSWGFLILPLGFFLTWRGILRKEGKIINLVGAGIFLLAAYQLRYMRWVPFFSALWHGNLLFDLVCLIYRKIPAWERQEWSVRKRLLICFLCFWPIFGVLIGSAYEGQNRNGPEYGADFINAMFWLQRNTPDPGGYYDSKVPDYGVVNFWDLGNAVAFYGKRPPICSNLILGLDSMTAAFSTSDEEEAYSISKDLKARYWIVSAMNPGMFEKTLPQLKAATFSDGSIPLSQPKIDWNKLPPLEEKKTMHGRLFRTLGFGKSGERGVSRFRLIYTSLNLLQSSHPWLKIFEVVPGAEIIGTSVPNATVTCRLNVQFPLLKAEYPYWNHAVCDRNGKFRIRVPYATDQKCGGVETAHKYLLTASGPASIWKASVAVSLNAVQMGLQAAVTQGEYER